MRGRNIRAGVGGHRRAMSRRRDIHRQTTRAASDSETAAETEAVDSNSTGRRTCKRRRQRKKRCMKAIPNTGDPGQGADTEAKQPSQEFLDALMAQRRGRCFE